MSGHRRVQFIITLLCMSKCLGSSRLFYSDLNNATSNKTLLADLIQNIEDYASNETILTTMEAQKEKKDVPQDCSQREKLKVQPIYDQNARFKKCCPLGESMSLSTDNQTELLCDSTNLKFSPNIISGVLYDNCIEDNEIDISLPFEIGNPCNSSFVFNDQDDNFFVLQDGSLLIIDKYGNDSYKIENQYCLDMDNVSGTSYAVVCLTSVQEHLKRSQILIVATLMLISIPCLICVSFLHIRIKELRTLHGLSLSLMCSCLAIGYFLHSLMHILNISLMNISYAVQFFILSYFFWFFCLCCNVLINIWFKIPQNKKATKLLMYGNFAVYCLLSFSCPLWLVILTIQKGFPGTPSYFKQGFTESIRESQRYFIPPVSSVLFISFMVMVASFFGFQKIKKQIANTKEKDNKLYTNINMKIDEERYEEVKKDAKCISFLGIIMIITWLLEIVTFYSTGSDTYMILLDMTNGLQGVFIMLIFVVIRRRRTIILRWWYNRGSHDLESIELSAMNK